MKESKITARIMLIIKNERTITSMTINMAARTGFVAFIKLYIVSAQLSFVII